MSGSRTPSELVEQLKLGRSAFPGGKPDSGIIWPEILCEQFRRDVVAIESKVVFLPPDYYDDTWMCRLGQ
jgi:hypothetical protein